MRLGRSKRERREIEIGGAQRTEEEQQGERRWRDGRDIIGGGGGRGMLIPLSAHHPKMYHF